MKREKNVPDKVTTEHIGMKILYRLPNQAFAMEGTIIEVSPGGDYFHVGKHWIENGIGAVLSVIAGRQGRREAFR